jgi:hypothetical protein
MMRVKEEKPTKEELEANSAKALEEIEKLEEGGKTIDDYDTNKIIEEEDDTDDSDDDIVDDDGDSSDGDNDDGDEEESEDESGEDRGDEEEVRDESKDDEKRTVDQKKPETAEEWKEKFTHSSREAQILHAKNKKVNEAIEEASKIEPPTEDEMKGIYSDWEEMTEFEKRMAKDNEANKRFKESITKVTTEFSNMDKWQQKVDTFLDDPANLSKYPGIDGREEQFKMFATKQSRVNVDFEDLIPAFLFKAGEKRKAGKSKGKMFPTGKGGAKKKSRANDGKISQAAARQLRKNDYNKWRQFVSAGKIRSEF